MSDFFYLSLQAMANQIGRVFSLNTVARLARYNYGGEVRAPKLVPQKLMAVKFESVVTALAALATSSIVTPTPELEAWLRGMMGAPEAEKATIVQERAARQTVSLPGPANQDKPTMQSKADAGAGVSQTGGDSLTEKPAPDAKVAAAAATAAGKLKHAPPLVGAEVKTRRAPVGAEKSLALSDIVTALDAGRDEVAAALRTARPAIQAEIIHKVLNRPVGQMHRASVDADQALVKKVAGILQGISDFGYDQVGKERAKQKAGAAVPDAATVRMADARTKDPIGLYADGVVSEFTNTLSARATNAAIDWKRRGVSDGQVIQGVQADLEDQSDKWIDGVGSKGANEAFAEGREAGYTEYADEIGSVIYSAILDLMTCEACQAADGTEGATPDEIDDVPNPDCDGGDRCRCVHVYVFADEVKSAK